MVSNTGNAIGYGNAGQPVAFPECDISNAGNTVGDGVISGKQRRGEQERFLVTVKKHTMFIIGTGRIIGMDKDLRQLFAF